ncbi:hypothetical protein BaRGS_00014376 [Batillaria attramentaria]|uniref:Uncharacterized protein n=1 Tax=Batillaria attramentaria TaxID=370345 RepID=A0ABD0L636_9CAEN
MDLGCVRVRYKLWFRPTRRTKRTSPKGTPLCSGKGYRQNSPRSSINMFDISCLQEGNPKILPCDIEKSLDLPMREFYRPAHLEYVRWESLPEQSCRPNRYTMHRNDRFYGLFKLLSKV